MPALSSAIRKAAILVSCLQRAEADALLDSMPEAQARRVREAMVRLEEIDADERDEIIQEFVHRGVRRATAQQDDSGVELAGGLAQEIASGAVATAGDVPTESLALVTSRRPFDFLLEADANRLAAFLRDERPQTVALVLSYLSSDQSARVAALLPEAQQSEVLRRLADLDEASPEILDEVEHALRERIERDERNRERRSAGLAIVARILDAAGPRLAKQWQSAIADDDAHRQDDAPKAPAPAPTKRPMTWSEFERLEPRRACDVVLATPPEVSVLALAGATPGFFQRLMADMQPDDARFYRRSTSQLSPTRLADIEAAQAQLAASAEQASSNIPSVAAFERAA